MVAKHTKLEAYPLWRRFLPMARQVFYGLISLELIFDLIS